MFLAKQAVALLFTIVWCALGTSLAYAGTLAFGAPFGLSVRVSAEEEEDVDKALHGESAYHHLAEWVPPM